MNLLINAHIKQLPDLFRSEADTTNTATTAIKITAKMIKGILSALVCALIATHTNCGEIE